MEGFAGSDRLSVSYLRRGGVDTGDKTVEYVCIFQNCHRPCRSVDHSCHCSSSMMLAGSSAILSPANPNPPIAYLLANAHRVLPASGRRSGVHRACHRSNFRSGEVDWLSAIPALTQVRKNITCGPAEPGPSSWARGKQYDQKCDTEESKKITCICLESNPSQLLGRRKHLLCQWWLRPCLVR
jgi:hypothetical protein